mmetsp:Transcript_26830/g.42078  ORF Transcript_26830/g.42078 Transcript_26830/m.42078 type:complete len:87 (+) Transcript_26830:198-458(+)|eukprot:CAMPEP_0201724120 /NCGR_PEP_ID=MMETSP0593-20130828/7955_1 /ASSEMBLY_ACC=CAM_ASM_000672 /TAXON_ID=267983 /ORGANISM="Skeletonema japonicum, Strain CCMP2506" /LENGTH=86 /DNA_ID=CAMNT_0048215321 /DNA_START=131 /DNA_END=391 /DNA_ORIENTATION=+
MPPRKVKKVMTLPINVIFGHLQKKNRVKIWLYEDTRMTIEGQIIGFDEYMNFVLDGASEIDTKTGKKTNVGRILLKGDSITLMQEA